MKLLVRRTDPQDEELLLVRQPRQRPERRFGTVSQRDDNREDILVRQVLLADERERLAVELANKLKPVVILTTYGTSAELAEAVRNGAVATLLKDTAARNIVNDIRSVVAGEKIIPARLLQQIEEDNAMDKLTPRQLQLLSSVAKGYSNADIAKQNNQSEIWIKKQLSAVFKSLGEPFGSRRPRPQQTAAEGL